MKNGRFIRDGRFCWQHKEVLWGIAEACDGRSDRAMVLAVYLALTWIGSDKKADTFTETKARIAERAGVSYRKAADVLGFLARLGVIAITGNVIDGTKELGPNTYTLCTECRRSGTPCRRSGTAEEEGSVPRIGEQETEERTEEHTEQVAPTGAGKRRRDPILDALARVDGSDPTQVTGTAWGAFAKAKKEILEVCPDLTTDEIDRRAANYRLHMRDAAITASALAKHWARCDRPPSSGTTTERYASGF